MLLPTLGSSPGKGVSSSVIVHDQIVVDGVEISVLEARNITDLMSWLQKKSL